MRGVAIFCAVWPGLAFAGAWDVFEEACVLPFERFEAFGDPGMDAVQMLPEGVLWLEADPDDGRRACRLESDDLAAGTAFEARFMSGGLDGPYARFAGNVVAYRSDGWLEPVVEAQMWREDGTLVMRMLETWDES